MLIGFHPVRRGRFPLSGVICGITSSAYDQGGFLQCPVRRRQPLRRGARAGVRRRSKLETINPAINYVIPRKGQREIQQMPQFYWIPAFAGMTGGLRKDTLFNRRFNNLGRYCCRISTYTLIIQPAIKIRKLSARQTIDKNRRQAFSNY